MLALWRAVVNTFKGLFPFAPVKSKVVRLGTYVAATMYMWRVMAIRGEGLMLLMGSCFAFHCIGAFEFAFVIYMTLFAPHNFVQTSSSPR